MKKHTIGESKKSKFNQFEVIIVADSNDGDYTTTRNFYSEDVFEMYLIDELVELLGKHSCAYGLESFDFNGYLDMPHGEYEPCHTLESVEVNYYDNTGTIRPVTIHVSEVTN
mgnify:CR=1 FL=1